MNQKAVFLCLLLFLFPMGCGRDKGTESENQPPVINDLSAYPTTVETGDTTTITVKAEDADGDALTYSWIYEPGSITGRGESITWTAPPTAGAYTITVTVDDGQTQVRQHIEITVVKANHQIDLSYSILSLHLAPNAYPGFAEGYYLLLEATLRDINPQIIDSVTVTGHDKKEYELKDTEPEGICLIENNGPSDSHYGLTLPMSTASFLGAYTLTVIFTDSPPLQVTKELVEAPLPLPEIIQPKDRQETSSTPTLTWQAVSGASLYEVRITDEESEPCYPLWTSNFLYQTTDIKVPQSLTIGETYKWYLLAASNEKFQNLSLTAGLFKVVSEGEKPKVIGTIRTTKEPTGKIWVGLTKWSAPPKIIVTGSVVESNGNYRYQIELPATPSDYAYDVRAWDDTDSDGDWDEKEIISAPAEDYLEYEAGQWYVSQLDNPKWAILSLQTPIDIDL
ncbi:MAG: PKD domain-containing protein [bacterium]